MKQPLFPSPSLGTEIRTVFGRGEILSSVLEENEKRVCAGREQSHRGPSSALSCRSGRSRHPVNLVPGPGFQHLQLLGL